MSDHRVKIVCDATQEVVRDMGPFPARQARRVADGAGRNLNWGEYSIVIDPPLPDGSNE